MDALGERAAKAAEKSSGLRTSTDWISTPTAGAAADNSRTASGSTSLVGLKKTATREAFGAISLRSSSFFPLSSGATLLGPVTLPPGRERLSTSPILSGYDEVVITMGIALVACFAARIACVPDATMTSGLSATNSVARPGKRRACLRTTAIRW